MGDNSQPGNFKKMVSNSLITIYVKHRIFIVLSFLGVTVPGTRNNWWFSEPTICPLCRSVDAGLNGSPVTFQCCVKLRHYFMRGECLNQLCLSLSLYLFIIQNTHTQCPHVCVCVSVRASTAYNTDIVISSIVLIEIDLRKS